MNTVTLQRVQARIHTQAVIAASAASLKQAIQKATGHKFGPTPVLSLPFDSSKAAKTQFQSICAALAAAPKFDTLTKIKFMTSTSGYAEFGYEGYDGRVAVRLSPANKVSVMLV
jgi:hypothetical protein